MPDKGETPLQETQVLVLLSWWIFGNAKLQQEMKTIELIFNILLWIVALSTIIQLFRCWTKENYSKATFYAALSILLILIIKL